MGREFGCCPGGRVEEGRRSPRGLQSGAVVAASSSAALARSFREGGRGGISGAARLQTAGGGGLQAAVIGHEVRDIALLLHAVHEVHLGEGHCPRCSQSCCHPQPGAGPELEGPLLTTAWALVHSLTPYLLSSLRFNSPKIPTRQYYHAPIGQMRKLRLTHSLLSDLATAPTIVPGLPKMEVPHRV